MLIGCVLLSVLFLAWNSHGFIAPPCIYSSCTPSSLTVYTISKDVETFSDDEITDMLDNNLSELIEDGIESDEVSLNDKKFMKLAIEIARSP
jgi:hypothetical protein